MKKIKDRIIILWAFISLILGIGIGIQNGIFMGTIWTILLFTFYPIFFTFGWAILKELYSLLIAKPRINDKPIDNINGEKYPPLS